jgi:hypothetical protein
VEVGAAARGVGKRNLKRQLQCQVKSRPPFS